MHRTTFLCFRWQTGGYSIFQHLPYRTQDRASDFIVCPMICSSNGTGNIISVIAYLRCIADNETATDVITDHPVTVDDVMEIDTPSFFSLTFAIAQTADGGQHNINRREVICD